MSSVTLPGTGGTVTFKYDSFGRRIYKSSSGGTSVFAYDEDNLVEETSSTGSVVARYSQGLNIDQPLAMLRSSATSYYHADGLGSITSLSSAAGSIANTYTYDSFGKLTASTGSLTNPFQFTSREFDSETGLYFYRGRYYDPSMGRFLGEDPAGFPASLNLFRYVENSPTNFIDPFGEDTVVIITYDWGLGSHAAVQIDDSGDLNIGPVLFDPGGTYGGDQRGSGGFFNGSGADLQKYIDYQQGTGSRVEVIRFATNSREEREIWKRIEDTEHDPGPGFCAAAVSDVLDGIGPFDKLGRTFFPGRLANQIHKLKDDFFLEEQHRKLVRRLLPHPPI